MKLFNLLCTLFCATAVSASNDGYQSSNNANGNYYNQFSVCSDSVIVVQDLSIVCDSPGTYYYGSNLYRDSSTCQAGDKAKLRATFEILQDLQNSPYIDVYIKGYGSVESKQLYSGASLCSASITAKSGQSCPAAGIYQLSENFYWGSKSDSYDYGFVPKVTIGFSSYANHNKYDLGGANTDKCSSGSTFTTWTTGVSKTAANTVRSFVATFGILAASLLIIMCAGYCIFGYTNRPASEVVIDEEDEAEADYHKITMVGKNRDLVDF